jgi:protein-disulfide isomerase
MTPRLISFAIFVFGLALGSASFAQTHAAAKTAGHVTPVSNALPEPVKTYGNKSAPITLEVFSDYQCPSCRNFFETTLRPMISDYVASGKVYLVHRDFPLSMHLYSGQAARWANAAGQIGEFESVEAALYDNQNTWSVDGNIEKILSGAMSSGNFKRLETIVKGCENPPIYSKPDKTIPAQAGSHLCAADNSIAHDIQLGYQVPVQATPTYVIYFRGQHISSASGPVSWPLLKQFFDSLLAK